MVFAKPGWMLVQASTQAHNALIHHKRGHSMSDATQGLQALGKFVPGFDFLQGLVKNAGSTMPFSQWVAPTLDPKELDKRIDELRTVQFWLEQNARMLGTTIQALEVQRMTLSTLQNMNVSAEALRDALKIRVPEPPAAKPRAAEPRVEAAEETGDEETGDEETATKAAAGKKGDAAGDVAADPMQWWGALTRQFATLATNTMTEALKETATVTESARNLAATVAKPATGDAGEAPRKGASTARKASAKASRPAAGTASKPAGAAKSPARRPTRPAPKS